jgi:hypothetical protein
VPVRDMPLQPATAIAESSAAAYMDAVFMAEE